MHLFYRMIMQGHPWILDFESVFKIVKRNSRLLLGSGKRISFYLLSNQPNPSPPKISNYLYSWFTVKKTGTETFISLIQKANVISTIALILGPGTICNFEKMWSFQLKQFRIKRKLIGAESYQKKNVFISKGTKLPYVLLKIFQPACAHYTTLNTTKVSFNICSRYL